MNDLQTLIKKYMDYCNVQKCLDEKTLKAYRIDLRQFSEQICTDEVIQVNSAILESFIATLHCQYKPKTVKRKIASIKAFFHFLEYKDFIEQNPFNKVLVHFREPVKLPKTIPLPVIEALLTTIYSQHKNAGTAYQRRNALRDDVNLYDGTILIYGKGNKERRIQIGNESVLQILREYQNNFNTEINHCNHFFVNQNGNALSDQAVRRMIKKYSDMTSINMHITPHMFRHTFATSLLEADVDIRYIQEMLGHSSINITEIYTHVAVAKQRDILVSKHPRKDFRI